MLPEKLNSSKLYGVELDSISGRIAKQLYQNAYIQINSHEKTNLPDSFFDVAIGNVPFGEFKVNDEIYDNLLNFDGDLREPLEYYVDDSISKITNSYTEKVKQNKAKER